jgi:DNA-binding transcriptional regulator GbsR (MarR family)
MASITNVETFKNNCREFACSHKAVAVLKNANEKNTYLEISKIVGIYKTNASSLLKKAETLGLATKTAPGIYKKLPGVLGYMPSFKNKVSKNVSSLVKKLERNRKPTKKFITPSSLNVSSGIENKLDKMARSYTALYATENALRALIRKVLNQQGWWTQCVPSGIQKDVEDAISKTPYDAAKRNDELEYAHLGQLKEVIIAKKNWNSFLPYLKEKNKSSFSATIDKAISSRNAIAHCIPLKDKDLKIADVRFEDILKMIN